MPRVDDQPNELQLLATINDRLSSLLILTALAYTAGKNQHAAIESLAGAGMAAKTISDVTGWPTTTVAPVVSKLKAKKSPRSSASKSARKSKRG